MATKSTASQALQLAKQELAGLTVDYSLDAIDSDKLKEFEVQATNDDDLCEILREFQTRLSKKEGPSDTIASAQAYEIYGEAIAYTHLLGKFKTRRLPTRKNIGTPDFECQTQEGKTFFVEVKSLDIVGGEFRHDELQREALGSQIEIEKQLRQGRRIAFGETEFAPYRELGEKVSSSPHGRATETISKKLRGAFKGSQFKDGPTFAYAISDKLIIPGDQHSITPYYTEKIYDGFACMTGCLWMAVYGSTGMLILDPYEFEGKGNIGGLLVGNGIFSAAEKHPAQGLIFSNKELSSFWTAGLFNPHAQVFDNWEEDDTDQVIHQLAEFINNDRNERAFELAFRA